METLNSLTLPSGRKVITHIPGSRIDLYRGWIADYPALQNLAQLSQSQPITKETERTEATREYMAWAERIIEDHVRLGVTIDDLKSDGRDMWYLWLNALGIDADVEDFARSERPAMTAQAYCDLTILLSSGRGFEKREQN